MPPPSDLRLRCSIVTPWSATSRMETSSRWSWRNGTAKSSARPASTSVRWLSRVRPSVHRIHLHHPAGSTHHAGPEIQMAGRRHDHGADARDPAIGVRLDGNRITNPRVVKRANNTTRSLWRVHTGLAKTAGNGSEPYSMPTSIRLLSSLSSSLLAGFIPSLGSILFTQFRLWGGFKTS